MGWRSEFVSNKVAGERGCRPKRGCHAKRAGLFPTHIIFYIYVYQMDIREITLFATVTYVVVLDGVWLFTASQTSLIKCIVCSFVVVSRIWFMYIRVYIYCIYVCICTHSFYRFFLEFITKISFCNNMD